MGEVAVASLAAPDADCAVLVAASTLPGAVADVVTGIVPGTGEWDLETDKVPKTWKAAQMTQERDMWNGAMKTELDGLEANGVLSWCRRRRCLGAPRF